MRTIVLIITMFFSISAYSQATLSEMAAEIDKYCKQNKSTDISFCEFTACKFYKNATHFYVTFNAGRQFNLVYFKAKPKEAKEWFKILMTHSYQASPYFFNRMIEKKVSLIYHVTDNSNMVSDIIALSPADIKSAIVKYGNMKSCERTLHSQVISSNIQSPMVVDEVTTIDKAILTNSSLEYDYTIDDSALDMNSVESYVKTNRSDVIQSYKVSYAYNSIVTALKESNRTLKIVYRGKYTKQIVAATFYPYEFK